MSTEELLLQDISKYRFITHGMQHLPNSSDREEFQDTLRAMEIMGITHDDVKCEIINYLFVKLFVIVELSFITHGNHGNHS